MAVPIRDATGNPLLLGATVVLDHPVFPGIEGTVAKLNDTSVTVALRLDPQNDEITFFTLMGWEIHIKRETDTGAPAPRPEAPTHE